MSVREAALAALAAAVEHGAEQVTWPVHLSWLQKPVVQRDTAIPPKLEAEGLIIVPDGAIQSAMVELSPPRWEMTHQVSVVALFEHEEAEVAVAARAAMVDAVAAAVGEDPTLGGAVDDIEIRSGDLSALGGEGMDDLRGAQLVIVMTYESERQLG